MPVTDQYIQHFLLSRQSRGLSNRTIQWYRGILNKYMASFPVLPTGADDIERFIIDCPGGDERKHGYYRAIRCFHRFLERRYDIYNPVNKIDPPKRTHKVPLTLTYQELEVLLTYPHEPRIKAALLFLADTGARLSELYSLKPCDFKKDGSYRTATMQGKTGYRTIPVREETYRQLIKQIPFPYSCHRLGRKISLAFKAAGVRGTAHTLRHTFATLWDGDVFALQKIMGHTNLQTLAIYRNLNFDMVTKQYKRHNPINRLMSGKQPHVVV